MMADEDDQNVRMPMGDRDYVAEDSDNDDDIRRGENEHMDDLGEDDSAEEESDNNDDEEDESDDGIESEEEEEEEEVHDESVHKFIRTFSNGDYDTEFDDGFSYDRSAVVPNTRPTQASYNKPDDWRDRNRIGLEKVKEQLQNCIYTMMHRESLHLNSTHNDFNYELLIDNEEPIVWHEPILDMYWNKLEANIDQVRQLEIVTTNIVNVEMKKDRLAALVAIVISGRATNSSTVFNFENANLCADGIISLSKLVDVSSELQFFHLCHNRIDNMESARCLSRSLKSHHGINILSLSYCDLGSSPEILLVILQSDVSHIGLSNNNIDSLGAATIAEYIESDPPIERLSLGCNRLNDDDAILISQALKRNTNLCEIYLHTNNFTSIGVKALLTSVFDSSSLNSMSESNHTLGGMNMFWRGNNETNDRLQYCINRLLEMDRTQKIVFVLQDKDYLLKYLTNVPIELIPEVLAFPLRRIDNEHQHDHLNIVYCTMRWWNMPMLYSYCNCVKSDTKKKRDK